MIQIMGAELKFEKVLVLSPHTDDGELGAGGTIVKLAEGGHRYFMWPSRLRMSLSPRALNPAL